jgi:hypothetical protein
VTVSEAMTLAGLGELLQLPEAGVTALLKVRERERVCVCQCACMCVCVCVDGRGCLDEGM